MAGVDLATAKELSGHKTFVVCPFIPSHKVKAVDMLDNAFDEISTGQKLHSLRGNKKEFISNLCILFMDLKGIEPVTPSVIFKNYHCFIL